MASSTKSLLPFIFSGIPSKTDVQKSIDILTEAQDGLTLKRQLIPFIDEHFKKYTDRREPVSSKSQAESELRLRTMGFDKFISTLQPEYNDLLTGKSGDERREAWQAVKTSLDAIKLAADSRGVQALSQAASHGHVGRTGWSETANSLATLTSFKAATGLAEKIAALGICTMKDMKECE